MRRRLGPPGVLAGVAGSLLLVLSAVQLRNLPSAGASDLDVYAYFLDHRDSVRIGAAIALVGLAVLVPFLATMRLGETSGPRRPAAMATLVCGALAIAALAFAAAVVGGLAVGAENAEPGSSRTLLDIANALTAAAGPLLAIAILTAAADAHDAGAPAWVPALWSAAGIACMLWLGPLITDASIVSAGSILGTFAGLAGLVVWTVSAALIARRPDPRAQTPAPDPAPAPPPLAPQAQ